MKKYPIIGCCGLDCGLCPRYYTEGRSKCNGCGSPTSRPNCSIFRCCVNVKGYETCAECRDFPCPRFKDAWEEYDSFLTHRKMRPNLKYIKEHGVESHVWRLRERMRLLKKMLEEFNEGRSKSFYCIAVTLLPLENIKGSLDAAEKKVKELNIGKEHIKTKAKILRDIINRIAESSNIDLKLRKPPKEK